MSRPSILLALALASLSWTAAIAAAPAARAPSLSAGVYVAGSLICHQQPERSFQYGGAQYPVCARCLGLYAGGALGVLLWMGIAGPGHTRRLRAHRFTSYSVVRWTLVLAALPTVVTLATAWLGWWDADNTVRAVLALPLGLAMAATITAVAAGDLR